MAYTCLLYIHVSSIVHIFGSTRRGRVGRARSYAACMRLRTCEAYDAVGYIVLGCAHGQGLDDLHTYIDVCQHIDTSMLLARLEAHRAASQIDGSRMWMAAYCCSDVSEWSMGSTCVQVLWPHGRRVMMKTSQEKDMLIPGTHTSSAKTRTKTPALVRRGGNVGHKRGVFACAKVAKKDAS
jgi:hypothetical protein